MQPASDALPFFNRLYGENARALHAYLLGRTNDGCAAEDLLQELFLRVWRHLADVRRIPEERRRFWLYRIARNLATDHYRRQAARPPDAGRSVEDLSRADQAAGLGEILDTSLDMDAAIARLPEHLRVVLVMSAVGGLNSTEIGQVLERPPATVRSQLAQARRLLAEWLGFVETPMPTSGEER